MNPSFIILTDFFAVSAQSLAYTTSLAAAQQARVVLLHVCHDGLRGPGEKGNLRTEWNKQQKRRELEQLVRGRPVPTELIVSEEFFPDAVRQTVRAHQGHLLVLSQPGAAEQPVGVVTGVAMQLLEQSLCPVLVVPAAAWEVVPPRRLLLAVDGQPFGLGVHAEVVRRLLQTAQSTLSAVHVATDDHGTATDTSSVLNSVRANHLGHDFSASQLHEVQHAQVAAGVLAEAVRQEADLLVVVARRHSLLGSLFHRSVTGQLIEQSPIPLLLLSAEE